MADFLLEGKTNMFLLYILDVFLDPYVIDKNNQIQLLV